MGKMVEYEKDKSIKEIIIYHVRWPCMRFEGTKLITQFYIYIRVAGDLVNVSICCIGLDAGIY